MEAMGVATVGDPEGPPRCREAAGADHRTVAQDQVGRLQLHEVGPGPQAGRIGVETTRAVAHRLTSEATGTEGNLLPDRRTTDWIGANARV